MFEIVDMAQVEFVSGYIRTKEHREKMSRLKIGHSDNKGILKSEEHKRNLSEAKLCNAVEKYGEGKFDLPINVVGYLSGFFDGDGSVFLKTPNSKRWMVSVCQSIEDPLLLYKTCFGEDVSFNEKNGPYSTLPKYEWKCSSTILSLRVLQTLYPYLIVRRGITERVFKDWQIKYNQSDYFPTLAYCGGFFDAEGSVSVCLRSSGGVGPVVQVTQLIKEPLEIFKQQFGGSILFVSGKYYKWSCNSQEILKKFCNDLLPHLIVKRKQVELLLELCQIRLWNGGGDSRINRKLEIGRLIRELNKF